MRLDKFLWAIRLFKTRGDATEACKGSAVKVNDLDVKPSKEIKEGDIIRVRKGAVYFTYKMIAPVENRQPAKNVPLYAENLTPPEELEKLHQPKETITIYRERGSGRPTKKERRVLDKLMDDLF